jgi:hypothetical protein
MTRYVTNGAGASAPSENLGFYFGGLRGQDWGAITSDDASANSGANTLISVNMSSTTQQSWSNQTLPTQITTRANAVMQWLPVSQSGILVVIGGITIPSIIYPNGLSDSQKQENVRFL